MVEKEKVFDKGETAIIELEIKDTKTLELIDPESVKITVKAEQAIKVDNKDMKKDSKGKYHYDYTVDTEGRHFVTITASQLTGARITIETCSFLVRDLP